MITSWVEIRGVKEVIKLIADLPQYHKSAEFRSFQNDTNRYAMSFWKDHIYSYFDARIQYGLEVTGQLGNSINISTARQRVSFMMNPIYNRRDGREYGSLLRDGFPSSPGAYSPIWDRRLKTGMHPGYNASSRWIPWLNRFRSEVGNVSGQYHSMYVDRYLRRKFG